MRPSTTTLHTVNKRAIPLLLGVPAMAGGTALLAWTLGLLTMFVKGGGGAEIAEASARGDVRMSEALMLGALLLASLAVLVIGHFLLYPRTARRTPLIPARTWRGMAMTLFVLSIFATLVLLLRGYWTDLAIPVTLAALGFWCVAAAVAQGKLDLAQLHPGVRAALREEE